VVEAGEDGLLVEWQNSEELAQAAISLLRNPPLARSMGESGKKKVLAKYTWPAIARLFRGVYAQAAAEAPKK
jgi:glycosyltransferase involved in cell wall biosynthesis